MPWIHLYVSPHGKVTPCCLSDWDEESVLSDINEDTLENIWNGRKFRQLRKRMLQDKPTKGCWQCYDNEERMIPSKRQEVNALYEHKADWLLDTSYNGKVSKAKPIYLDIRVSNLCNLKCRICAHHSSSAWYEDAVEINETYFSSKVYNGVKDFDKLLDELDLLEIEEIYFAGGEPLLMESHYKLLNALIENNRHDVKLRYATNFSVDKFKKQSIFEMWSNFSEVWIHASIDDMGKKLEFQRSGIKWESFKNRVQLLKTICPNVNFTICTAVSAYNIDSIKDFHLELVKEDIIKYYEFLPHLVRSPEKLSIQILPQKAKDRITKQLNSHIDFLRGLAPNERIEFTILRLRNIVSYMHAKDKSGIQTQFLEYNKSIDYLRDEDVREHVKWLEDVI